MTPFEWFAIAMFVVSLAVSVVGYVNRPKPQDATPAALTEFEVPQADEGKCITVIFGTVDVNDPNVVWYGDLYAQPITQKSGK